MGVRALGIGEGDEVLTTPFSFVASANCLLYERRHAALRRHRGGQPRDGPGPPRARRPRRGPGPSCRSTSSGGPAGSRRSSASPASAAGRSSRTPARASGRRSADDRSGSFGDVAVFAFYPNKQITTGEGGMVVTDDPALAETSCAACATRAATPTGRGCATSDSATTTASTSCRRRSASPRSSGSPSCGAGRARVAAAYERALGGRDWVRLPAAGAGEDGGLVRLRRPTRRGHRPRRASSAASRSGASRSRPYFTPLHLQPFYRAPFGFKPGDFPVTERVAASTLALPFSSRLPDEDVQYVADVLGRRGRCRPVGEAAACAPATRLDRQSLRRRARIARAGSRHFDLARQLVRRGRSVTIFAAGFSHVTGREERPGSAARLFRTTVFDGVRFVWLRTMPYRGNTLATPGQHAVASSLVVRGRPDPRSARPDVVIGSTVHPFAALGAWIVARSGGRAFVFEIRDLWPQTLGRSRARCGSDRRASGCCGALEAFLVRGRVGVITLLPGMRGLPRASRGCRRTTWSTSRTASTSSHSRRRIADPADRRRPYDDPGGDRSAARRRARFVVGYVGSFGRVNRVDIDPRAARELAERASTGRVGLMIVGDGPERADLWKRQLERAVVDRPRVPVPKRFVPVVLRALDATVVHATATPGLPIRDQLQQAVRVHGRGSPGRCSPARAPTTRSRPRARASPSRRMTPRRSPKRFSSWPTPAPRGAPMGAAGREYVVREHNMAHLGEVLAEVVAGRAR